MKGLPRSLRREEAAPSVSPGPGRSRAVLTPEPSVALARPRDSEAAHASLSWVAVSAQHSVTPSPTVDSELLCPLAFLAPGSTDPAQAGLGHLHDPRGPGRCPHAGAHCERRSVLGPGPPVKRPVSAPQVALEASGQWGIDPTGPLGRARLPAPAVFPTKCLVAPQTWMSWGPQPILRSCGVQGHSGAEGLMPPNLGEGPLVPGEPGPPGLSSAPCIPVSPRPLCLFVLVWGQRCAC